MGGALTPIPAAGGAHRPQRRAHQPVAASLSPPEIPPALRCFQTLLFKCNGKPDAAPFLVPVADQVDASIAGAYANAISHPMDLGTIQRNIETGSYGCHPVDALNFARRDFELVCTNCEAFNPPGSPCFSYTKRAYRLRTWINKELEKALAKLEKASKRPRKRCCVKVKHEGGSTASPAHDGGSAAKRLRTASSSVQASQAVAVDGVAGGWALVTRPVETAGEEIIPQGDQALRQELAKLQRQNQQLLQTHSKHLQLYGHPLIWLDGGRQRVDDGRPEHWELLELNSQLAMLDRRADCALVVGKAFEIIKRNPAARALLSRCEGMPAVGEQEEEPAVWLDLETLDTRTLIALQSFVKKALRELHAKTKAAACSAGRRHNEKVQQQQVKAKLAKLAQEKAELAQPIHYMYDTSDDESSLSSDSDSDSE